MNKTMEGWKDLIGPRAWMDISGACEWCPSVDAAEYTAVAALNALEKAGLFATPPPRPVIADCTECGPIRWAWTTDFDEAPSGFVGPGYCYKCEGAVAVVADEVTP